MSEGRRLQHLLMQVGSCVLAALHHPIGLGEAHDLVVCDVALDSLNAVDLLRATLAQLGLAQATPILCLLRDPSHLTKAQARMAGATATLLAQAQPKEIVSTVRALLHPALPASRDAAATDDLGACISTAGALMRTILGQGGTPQTLSAETLDRASGVLLMALTQARIQAWLDVVWTYDDVTYQHCLLVAGLATAFAIELGLPPKSQHLLSQAALVHDIGKSQIPRQILNKAGPLTPAEAKVVRSHPAIGHAMLARQRGFDPCLLDAVRHHHEYLDGSGYPDGLRGSQISRLVRMVTICDIYAALIERRPYKAPTSPQAALNHLVALGPKLDTALVGAFRNVVRDT